MSQSARLFQYNVCNDKPLLEFLMKYIRRMPDFVVRSSDSVSGVTEANCIEREVVETRCIPWLASELYLRPIVTDFQSSHLCVGLTL